MPIREVGRSGERENPRGRRKKRKKARVGRLGARLKHHLGAIDLGAVLDANNHGAKLGANNHDAKLGTKMPVKSPSRLRRAQELGAIQGCNQSCEWVKSVKATLYSLVQYYP